jgi:hypothetical protein
MLFCTLSVERSWSFLGIYFRLLTYFKPIRHFYPYAKAQAEKIFIFLNFRFSHKHPKSPGSGW